MIPLFFSFSPPPPPSPPPPLLSPSFFFFFPRFFFFFASPSAAPAAKQFGAAGKLPAHHRNLASSLPFFWDQADLDDQLPRSNGRGLGVHLADGKRCPKTTCGLAGLLIDGRHRDMRSSGLLPHFAAIPEWNNSLIFRPPRGYSSATSIRRAPAPDGRQPNRLPVVHQTLPFTRSGIFCSSFGARTVPMSARVDGWYSGPAPEGRIAVKTMQAGNLRLLPAGTLAEPAELLARMAAAGRGKGGQRTPAIIHRDRPPLGQLAFSYLQAPLAGGQLVPPPPSANTKLHNICKRRSMSFTDAHRVKDSPYFLLARVLQQHFGLLTRPEAAYCKATRTSALILAFFFFAASMVRGFDPENSRCRCPKAASQLASPISHPPPPRAFLALFFFFYIVVLYISFFFSPIIRDFFPCTADARYRTKFRFL